MFLHLLGVFFLYFVVVVCKILCVLSCVGVFQKCVGVCKIFGRAAGMTPENPKRGLRVDLGLEPWPLSRERTNNDISG